MSAIHYVEGENGIVPLKYMFHLLKSCCENLITFLMH
jgi:hypothetical protein